MPKVNLLREDEVAKTFRKALRKNGSAALAVAFWGKDAIRLLGFRKEQDLQIICNLDHPGCNPHVIEELRAMKVKLWRNPRLHAKIYLTPTLAIVGSWNVSSNGLAVEGSAAQGWLEANVAGTAPSFIAAAEARFQEIMDHPDTKPVRAADIKRAIERRIKFPPAMLELPESLPLFEAVKAHPEAFSSVYLAIYDEGLDEEAEPLVDAANTNIAAQLGKPRTPKLWGYQLKSMPRDAWLIDVSCDPEDGPPHFVGTARVIGDPIPVFRRKACRNDLTLALSPAVRRVQCRACALRRLAFRSGGLAGGNHRLSAARNPRCTGAGRGRAHAAADALPGSSGGARTGHHGSCRQPGTVDVRAPPRGAVTW